MKNSRLISLCAAFIVLFLVVALLSVLKSCTHKGKTEHIDSSDTSKINSVISFDQEGDHGILICKKTITEETPLHDKDSVKPDSLA
jgi:hypothetical protein